MEKYSLNGVSGNAFGILAYVSKAMKECGLDKQEIAEYQEDAKSGDYHHLIASSIEMIDFLNDECID